MNAKPKPPSSADLTFERERYEKDLIEARRINSAARSQLPARIAEADSAGIADCRREMTGSAARIKELTAEIDIAKEAIKQAEARELVEVNRRTHRHLKTLVAAARRSACELEDSIVVLGAALLKARTAIEKSDAELRSHGIVADVYLLQGKLIGISEVRLHLESEGILGVRRGLDSHAQLRANGAASLKKAAELYEALTMTRVRAALGISSQSEQSENA